MDEGLQYAIDMAARLNGGESSISQLAELADKLTGAGNAATSFDRAIAQTRSALELATTASKDAASALADGETRYAELERAAVRAAQAVERAGQKMSGAVPADLMQRAKAADAALRAEAATLDDLRAKSLAAAAAQSKVADTLKRLEAGAKAEGKLANATSSTSESMEKLGGVLSRLGGPLGAMGAQATSGVGAMSKLAAAMGGTVAAAVALVAVVALVVVGIGAAIVKTTQWAIGLADAARASNLQTEALEQTSAALAGLSAIIPSIQNATELSREEIEGLAKALDGAKVAAADMPAALRAAATAEAALGKGGAAKFIADLEAGKLTVAEFADEVDQKFGGIVAQKLLGLDSQAARFKRNLGATFGGLEINPLLEALSRLVDLFDQNTAMGQLLGTVFETVFQPFVDGATEAIYMLEAFALGAAIAGLKVYIFFKPLIKVIKDLFGKTDSALPDALETAAFLGEMLAGTFLTITAIIVGMAAPLIVAAGLFAAFIGLVSTAWDALISGGEKAIDWLSSISLVDIGADLIGGLATGITEGGAAVVGAITGVVGDAIKTAKRMLGIASDSKVFKSIGGYTVGGFEHEVERSTPRVQSALESMVEAPEGGPSSGAASQLLTQSKAGHTFEINVYAAAGADGDGIAAKVKAVLLELLEGDVTQVGAGEMEPVT